VTRLGGGRPRNRVRFPAGEREFFLLHRVKTDYWVQSVSYAESTEGCFCAGKSTYSPPSAAKGKNSGNCFSTLPYVFMARCLIKYSDNFHSLTHSLTQSRNSCHNRKQIRRPHRFVQFICYLPSICARPHSDIHCIRSHTYLRVGLYPYKYVCMYVCIVTCRHIAK
jgi:hypothetical protein